MGAVTNEFNHNSHTVAAPLTIIIPRTRKRYKLSADHCAISLTEREIILTQNATGWQGMLYFIADNMPERQAVKLLAAAEVF